MLCNQCAGCALAVTTAASDTAECSGGVIAAGTVCTSEICGTFDTQAESGLARISFPIQQYSEGFCPCEAFEQGTMFPELVQ